MIESKLSNEEAMAIQILERDPNWQKFKEYVSRQYARELHECETVKDDHRYHQGRTFELREMARIEEKAFNILSGINQEEL